MKKIALFPAALITATLLGGCVYSDGDRAGQIIKFSHKGAIWKTWEGEMNLGGIKTNYSTDAKGNVSAYNAANTFEFTVKDEKLVPKIEAALESGERVTLTYEQIVPTAPWDGSTGYFITGIRE